MMSCVGLLLWSFVYNLQFSLPNIYEFYLKRLWKNEYIEMYKRISSIESQNYKQDILLKYHAMNSSQ